MRLRRASGTLWISWNRKALNDLEASPSSRFGLSDTRRRGTAAIRDEAQAIGLITGGCLNDKDCAVDYDGSRNRFLVVGHGQLSVGGDVHSPHQNKKLRPAKYGSEINVCAIEILHHA
jgi:hypothetical protein